MKKDLGVAFLCVFAASIVPADMAQTEEKQCKPAMHAKVPRFKDLTYHAFRKKLLAAGWKPLRTKPLHKTEEDPDFETGSGQLFWKKGYVELEHCAGTGWAFCSFLFRDIYRNQLRVVTAGEEIPEMKSYARVDNIQFVCGEP